MHMAMAMVTHMMIMVWLMWCDDVMSNYTNRWDEWHGQSTDGINWIDTYGDITNQHNQPKGSCMIHYNTHMLKAATEIINSCSQCIWVTNRWMDANNERHDDNNATKCLLCLHLTTLWATATAAAFILIVITWIRWLTWSLLVLTRFLFRLFFVIWLSDVLFGTFHIRT